MAKRMDYFRAVVRFCIPIIALVVIAGFYSEPRLFWKILFLPLAIAIPLILWTTIKIIIQVRIGQIIAIKYLFIYGCSLIFIAVVVCFSFVVEAIGGHGSYSGPFLTKCLFAFTLIVAIPLIDLILYRSFQLADSERKQKIKHAKILSRVIFTMVAVFSFIWITWPPVNIALRQNHREITKILINLGFDIHKTDKWSCTPLWYAIHRADPEMMIILLNNGATLNQRLAGWGFVRAIETNNEQMLKLLLDNGADPNSISLWAPPLVLACQKKNMTIIKMLLDSGADINLRGSFPKTPWDGKSALDIAREAGDAQIVELLLSRGKNK
jgi:hypothetical protein